MGSLEDSRLTRVSVWIFDSLALADQDESRMNVRGLV